MILAPSHVRRCWAVSGAKCAISASGAAVTGRQRSELQRVSERCRATPGHMQVRTHQHEVGAEHRLQALSLSPPPGKECPPEHRVRGELVRACRCCPPLPLVGVQVPLGHHRTGPAIRSSAADDASAAISTARAAWPDCVNKANGLRTEMSAAAQECANRIEEAKGMRFQEPPGTLDLIGRGRDFIRENKDALKNISETGDTRQSCLQHGQGLAFSCTPHVTHFRTGDPRRLGRIRPWGGGSSGIST